MTDPAWTSVGQPFGRRRLDDLLGTIYQAIEANLSTSTRHGNEIRLESSNAQDVVVSADLHGHRENFLAILELADLAAHPQRHLVLQEVCHGGPTYGSPPADRGCQSHTMLAEVAALKAVFPERVHFILSNHELAELTGDPIRKDGCSLSLAFLMGIHHDYPGQAEAVHAAYMAFFGSCPLAVRIGPDVFVSHSTPEQVDQTGFDDGVLQRPASAEDFHSEGAASQLVWGRDYRRESAAAFAAAVGSQLLINGHTPCEDGFQRPNERQLILDCCSTPAACAVVPVRSGLTMQEVVASIRRLPATHWPA